MHLKQLNIKNFRNIKKASLDFNDYFNIIYGGNGNGKTNLLESIYFLTALKSIKKKTKLQHLINIESDYSNLSAVFLSDTGKEYIKMTITKEKKILTYNYNYKINPKKYLHKFQSVLFTPDDLMIIKGEPDNRRDFFNKAIFTGSSYYYDYIVNYNKILKSRNKILKTINEGNKENIKILNAINIQFADLSIKIYNERMIFLKEFLPIFIDTVKKISGKEYSPYLDYKTDFIYSNKDEFIKKLQKKQDREILNKRTILGPHLDDYRILAKEKEIKFYGSQGEIRLFTLALKISLIIFIYRKTNKYPILLLDDISSELDEKKKVFMFDFLKKINTQIFITTTELKNLPQIKSAKIIRITDGNIVKQ